MLDRSQSEYLYKMLQELAPIDRSSFSHFVKNVKSTSYQKGQFFTRNHENTDSVGFVQSGVFSVFYLTSEQKEVVRNFCHEGRFLGSLGTILSGQPSHVSIQALEDSVVFETSFTWLQRFFDQYGADWERLGRKIAENHYISREKREYQMMCLDAKARYQIFREEFPSLESRINQYLIASYIGVAPATLSRMRKAKR